MIQTVEKFLAGKTAREFIEQFDVDFDVPFKYNRCIGLLEMLGAYEQDGAENDLKLAERVGAWWCRIIRNDVLYHLLDGLESIAASRADADKLREKVLERSFDSAIPDKQQQFMAYAAARWHDGAGKIYYRCNDSSEARLLFKQAEELANQAKLWYCLPDIRSNLVRAEYEEHQTAGDEASLEERYQQLCSETLSIAAEHQISVPESWPDEGSLQNKPAKEREFLRGLASIFHNLSLEEKKSNNIKDSLNSSQRSEYICRGLSDKYRLAQALNHQGILAFNSSLWETSNCHFQKVLTMPWIRGQGIAKQNLAKLDAQAGKFPDACDSIKNLLKELQDDRKRRGSDLGLDLSFYFFTIEAYKYVLDQAEKQQKLNIEELNSERQRLEEDQMEMIRSIRKVVKIGSYKQAFAKRIYPLYLNQIANHIKHIPNSKDEQQERDYRERLEEGFTLVEEASSRELLDLLQSSGTWSNISLPDGQTPDEKEAPQEELTPATPTQARDQRCLSGIRLIRRDSDLDRSWRDRLEQRRRAYENWTLNHTIPTAQHNAEIAHELRMFAANHPKLAIARYFFYKDASKELGVYVFRETNIYYQPLNWQEVEPLLKYWDKMSPDSLPSDRRQWFEEKMTKLWELLIMPIWELIADGKLPQELQDHHLVIIPSDKLFRLPIHAALVPETKTPLAATIPLSFSVSATAYLTRGRHLLRCQPVEKDDDLCALIVPGVSGDELIDIGWSPKHFHIAGQPPDRVGKHHYWGKANRCGLQHLIEKQPEFFVYGSHGNYHESFNTLGAYLELEKDILTQFDIATMRLPRNKLTFLSACLSGRGVDLDGGEVSGFLKAFMAAGCGALGVTLWSVSDIKIALCIQHLLKNIRIKQSSGSFDVVQELHEYYKDACTECQETTDKIESCPLVLYL